MATLNIRNLPDDVHQALRLRAAQAGRSMEAEARAILTATCRTQRPKLTLDEVQRLVDEMYGENKPTVDEFLAERRSEAARE